MIFLDFNIQFGKFFISGTTIENTLSDLFFKVLPALITGGVAYYIFHRGQIVTRAREEEKELVNKKKEIEKENKRLNDLREYFFYSLLKFKLGISVQINIFEKIIGQLESDQIDSMSIWRPVTLSYDSTPEQLLQISRGDTFKFFIQERTDNKHTRIKIYSNFYGVIKLLERFIIQIEENNLKSHKKFEDSQKKIEKSKEQLINLLKDKSFNSFKEGSRGVISDPYYILMGKQYNNYSIGMDGTIEPIMNKFIFPIRDLSLTDDYIIHPDSKEVLNICKEAEYTYRRIFDDKRLDQENFSRWNTYYLSLNKIIVAMIDLEFKDFSFGQEIFLPENIQNPIE